MSDENAVKYLQQEIKMIINNMHDQCPRLMSMCVEGCEIRRPNTSLNYEHIRDIVNERPDELKQLLEECLEARSLFVSFMREISSFLTEQ